MEDAELSTHGGAGIPGIIDPFARSSSAARAVRADNGSIWTIATDLRTVRGEDQSGLAFCWKDGLPLEPHSTQWRRVQLAVKRIVDVVGAAFGLIALAPFLLFTAIAIKVTSAGPVLFRQDRIGLGGSQFRILKFRTMYAHRCDQEGTRQAHDNDDRITPLGKWLRAHSLDELPQLINVLFGDMSLVGPRPHVAGMLAGGVTYETLVPYYPMRYLAKPGLTGWAQANSLRGPTMSRSAAFARIDHDICYIQNFSVWLDARILVRTVTHELLRGTGT